MSSDYILVGKVVSGLQKASYFTQLDWVQDQCLEKFGFKPYPGTLNVEIEPESIPIIEALQKQEGACLIPPNPDFCAAKTLPVCINSVAGAIIIPAEDVRIHGTHIVEIIAPAMLKTTLDIKDGDKVKIVVKGGNTGEKP